MRKLAISLFVSLIAVASFSFDCPTFAAEAQYETRKVTENVYVFRFMGHQAMFVATADGVIATDPISPAASKVYLQEIRKITSAPVRYVVYSHHHLDHIAGGGPFKEAGATFVAHRRARERLMSIKNPHTVVPDLVVDDKAVLTLGGTQLELHDVGRNHSDNSLVMFLPREKIIFAVDFLPIREFPFRNMPDSHIQEWMQSIDRVLQIGWDRMIAGHPRQGGIGTKEDVRALKDYFTDLMEAVRQANAEGKCPDKAMKEVKLPKYEKWGRQEFLPGNIERMCYYWRNGWN